MWYHKSGQVNGYAPEFVRLDGTRYLNQFVLSSTDKVVWRISYDGDRWMTIITTATQPTFHFHMSADNPNRPHVMTEFIIDILDGSSMVAAVALDFKDDVGQVGTSIDIDDLQSVGENFDIGAE